MDRSEEAVRFFKEGYNCAQAVVAAYADDSNREMLLSAAEGFGGGMGRMRLTCGAVSGMCMMLSRKFGNDTAGDTETRKKLYELIREAAAEFAAENGSIICGELLGEKIPASSAPSERTSTYYKKRPCAECVRSAAKITGRYLDMPF